MLIAFIVLATVTSCSSPTPTPVVEVQIQKETVVITEKEEVVVEVTPTPVPPPDAWKPGMPFGEAPMLSNLVEAGSLPPAEERLPKIPCVGAKNIPSEWITPELGNYGGILRMADWLPGSWGLDVTWIYMEPWIHTAGIKFDSSKLAGNVMESFEVTPDGKDFTFHMREGMKWSDGEPLTTEDIRFWYEDVLLNERITPSVPAAYRSAQSPTGNPMKLEIVDEYTFTISFDEPYGGFLALLASDQSPTPLPSHFLKQFHPDYTPLEKLEPLIAENGFEPGEWWRLFGLMNNTIRDPGKYSRPNLSPWIVESVTTQAFKLVRNPYYFKIDAWGNQLPYIDYIEANILGNAEAALLKATAGEVDLGARMASTSNLPVLKLYEEKNGYRVMPYKMHALLAELYVNLTNSDPIWRQVVNDIRFRQALSYAIDRQQVIDAVYLGFAQLPSTIPLNEYNPDKANQLLDEMGLDKRDADGYRLGPDGKRFVIPIETLAVEMGDEPATAELAAKFWEAVGLKVTINAMERSLFGNTANANESHVITWRAHYPRWPWVSTLKGYAGFEAYKTYAPLWWDWIQTNGAEGEQPPEEYIEIQDMLVELWGTPDPARQQELWTNIKKIVTDNVWMIPTAEGTPYAVVVNANLGNLPETLDAYGLEVIAAAEMLYYK